MSTFYPGLLLLYQNELKPAIPSRLLSQLLTFPKYYIRVVLKVFPLVGRVSTDILEPGILDIKLFRFTVGRELLHRVVGTIKLLLGTKISRDPNIQHQEFVEHITTSMGKPQVPSNYLEFYPF